MTRGTKPDGDSWAKARDARTRQADARVTELAPIVAALWASGITSWYGIAKALNVRGIPTATGRGVWLPRDVRRVLARLK
jgi:hypothetical protein